MTKKGLLIVFSGPSGVGKDTVLQRFLPGRTDCAVSISATTRAPRPGEVDGRNYYFISRPRFEELVESGRMLEHACFAGNLYGTPAEAVERLRDEGLHVILEIEVQGALQIREKCPDAVFVFLMPPSLEALRARLVNRGTEPVEVMERRLAAAEREMKMAGEYEYVIVNDSVERSSRELGEVIDDACKKAACRDRISEVS